MESGCPKTQVESCSVVTAKKKQRSGKRFRPRNRRQTKAEIPLVAKQDNVTEWVLGRLARQSLDGASGPAQRPG